MKKIIRMIVTVALAASSISLTTASFAQEKPCKATAGLEFGFMRFSTAEVAYSPNLTPSVGVELLTKGKQAVMLTARTYINKDSVTGKQPNPGFSVVVGYRF